MAGVIIPLQSPCWVYQSIQCCSKKQKKEKELVRRKRQEYMVKLKFTTASFCVLLLATLFQDFTSTELGQDSLIHTTEAGEETRVPKAKLLCGLGNPFHHLVLSFLFSVNERVVPKLGDQIIVTSRYNPVQSVVISSCAPRS